ncbi:MAG: hypothetical protein KAJ75_07355 [Alphaproteobacteria bacterium]|nr:hypothetical protein [Alphaproteobacteria bacterium]
MTMMTMPCCTLPSVNTVNQIPWKLDHLKPALIKQENVSKFHNETNFKHHSKELLKIQSLLEQSCTGTALLDPHQAFEEELNNIIKECSEEDWDGEGALQLNDSSVRYAKSFIENLPCGVSLPEPVPEPCGELALVWKKNGYYIAIGIDSNAMIAYGGTTPSGTITGDLKFDGIIPKELLDLLKRIEIG